MPVVSSSDDELRFIFVKLLQFATDMPERYKQAFNVLHDVVPSSGDQALDADVLQHDLDYEQDLFEL